jgi:hypothetical protein
LRKLDILKDKSSLGWSDFGCGGGGRLGDNLIIQSFSN